MQKRQALGDQTSDYSADSGEKDEPDVRRECLLLADTVAKVVLAR